MTKLESEKEYWVKGRITQVDEGQFQPYKVVFGDEDYSDYIWIPESVEVVEVIPEREEVTIPKEVADWVVEFKACNASLHTTLNRGLFDGPKEISDWLLSQENQDTFARAWLDVYEIKKEPLYWVRDKDGNLLIYKSNDGVKIGRSGSYGVKCQEDDIKNYTFTEQEIKDYDERYWAFAVPAEEDDE